MLIDIFYIHYFLKSREKINKETKLNTLKR